MTDKIRKLREHVREYGLHGTAVAAADRILHRQQQEVPYERWLERSRPSSRDYARMSRKTLPREMVFAVRSYAQGGDRTAFMQSLSLQIYRNYLPLKDCRGSDYVLLCGSGCTLAPDLLWQCARYLAEADGEIDLIYFDSDRIGEDGRKTDPAFRPDYDPDLLEQVNYMGHVVLARIDAAKEAGLPAGGAGSFHAFLRRICGKHAVRAGEESGCPVRHIPKILYHELAEDAREDAAPQESAQDPGDRGAGDVSSASASSRPLVSVLIPNKDHTDDLARCIISLQQVNAWENLEILILENNSEQPETFRFYEKLQKTDPRIRVLTYDRPFNYSAVNNFGAANASGSLLLLLNNDTVILEKDAIARLACLALRDDVGAAGALLYYPDHTVQHAGIILGYGGIAGHAFAGEVSGRGPGVYPDLVFGHVHNVSAVTGACMMLRRSVFLKAGGFDEELTVAFNDVDLCMRLRASSLRVLMCPGARLIHNESASRGSEDSPEKVARFHGEIRTFIRKWEKELEKGDPFYNPNLTLTGRSWTCRDELRESVKPYVKYLKI